MFGKINYIVNYSIVLKLQNFILIHNKYSTNMQGAVIFICFVFLTNYATNSYQCQS